MEQLHRKKQKEEGITPEKLLERRKVQRESQLCFWSRFGVTQSRGSRFEMGAKMPSSVAILLKLYFDGIITDGDLWRARHRCRRVPPDENLLL